MNSTTNNAAGNIDLFAILAEVKAEEAAKEAEWIALEAKWAAEHKAEMKAYDALRKGR